VPVLPAVTCSVQSTFTTGLPPSGHGCVGNGWYYRDIAEVNLWRQSNHLVAGDKIWDDAKRRDPSFTCAKLFWWFNMYATADLAVTPRPMYPADGRKLPDIHTHPAELRDALQTKLGQFPLFDFWGLRAGLASAGSRAARSRSGTSTSRRFSSSTCHTSTTTCSGKVRAGPACRRRSATSTRYAAI
jgi:hypothetical protein